VAQSTVAGVITAIASVLTASALVISALALLLPILRKAKAIESKVEGVHIIVNQQRTDLQNYQVALIAALTKAGIDVPADQSLGAVGKE
jgi:hypothetical protein